MWLKSILTAFSFYLIVKMPNRIYLSIACQVTDGLEVVRHSGQALHNYDL